MEIGGAVAGETAKSIIGHLEREIGYLVHFRRNVDDLNRKFQQLIHEKKDVEQKICAATNNNEAIREAVNQWVKDVESVQTDLTQLFDEAEQISSCFKGWFCSRFRLGRKAYKKIVGIQDLLDQRNKFGDTVSDPITIPSLEHMCAYDYQKFASRKPLTKKIINALVDDNICLVGVFGMPGIGKTKLMEALSRHMIEKKQFDEVVMVTISQNPDVKTIQNNVGNQLGMQLKDNESISDRARHLHHRLKRQDKNILIVLDDVWKELNLEEVGIPKESRGKNYKIVIATRVLHVCDQMKIDRDLCFEVPILSEHDSWALFRENVGYESNSRKLETIDRKVGYVVDSCELEIIAKELVKECAGLPLAIVTLGKALRNKFSVSVWADALRRLQKSIYQDLMPVVDSLIKLSYDFLNEVQKRCFLFCSLFPEDYKINVKEELLVYVVGEKLLEDGVDCFDSLEETKGRLDSVVEDLISSSLLLRVYEEVGYTKMHDVIRDVAKMIAFKDEEFKHKADAVQTDLMKWPERLESCKRLSLMQTKIKCNFPKQVEAPQLLTLILTECEGFSKLPCDFFKEMKNLRNLDLSNTKIASLPSSISFLVELVTFRLRRCSLLENISPVGIKRLPEEMGMLTNSKKLEIPDQDLETRREMLRVKMLIDEKPEIIDLKESGKERLPEEIGMFSLKKLEIFDLYESGIERLPEEMRMLTNLEKLEIPDQDLETRREILRGKMLIDEKPEILDLKESGKERLSEEMGMFNLKKLEILDLYESGIESLPEEMRMLTNLKSLNLTKMGNLTSIPPKVISSMCQLEELYVDSFQKWEIGETGGKINANLSEVASLAKLTCMAIHIPYLECFSTNTLTHWVKLKTFRVYVTDGSNKVKWLLQTFKCFQRFLFIQIASPISNSNEVIWFLRRAEFVSLQNCNDLESVVQIDPTGGFKDNHLKCLEVRNCSKMKYLIEVERTLEISFSSLEILYFEDLDNLESICNGNTLPNEFLGNLRDLEFYRCRRLTCLIQNLRNSCSMLSIFSNLRRLSLYGCEEITYVLPMSVARHLNQLVDFSVVLCRNIERIIAIDNGKDDRDKYILPQLERLSLHNLPALLSFSLPGLVFDWALKKLILLKTGNLKSLPSRVTQQRLSKFEVFELDDTLKHLLEDSTIIDKLELRVDARGSYYYKKEKAEEESD